MPNQFLDIAGREDRTLNRKADAAAQGLRLKNGDICNKIIEGPFRVKNITTVALPAKPGVRYFVHSVCLSGTAAQNLIDFIQVIQDGVAEALVVYYTPAVAHSYAVSAVVDVLADVNTAVSATMPSGGSAVVTYREVNEYDS